MEEPDGSNPGPVARTPPRRPRKRWLRRLVVVVTVLLIIVAGSAVWLDATTYKQGKRQTGYLALTGATVYAGADLEKVPNATILVLDGVIAAVGTSSEVQIPEGATLIDVTGATILPGLIDLHVHLGGPDREARSSFGWKDFPAMILQQVRFSPAQRRSALEYGVTTVRNLGGEPGWIFDVQRQIEQGELEGPRLFVAGPVFTTRGGHPVATLAGGRVTDGVRIPQTQDEARAMVRDLALSDPSVDVIKVVHDRGGPRRALEPIDPDILQAIVDEAHLHGLKVTAHWGTFEDLSELLDAGVDGLEHLESHELVDGWDQALLDALVATGIPATPTLAVAEAGLPLDDLERLMAALKQSVGEFFDAGGTLVAGSDAGMPGVPFGAGLHRELELFVESGLTPREALMAATVNAARVLGVDAVGTIAPGSHADLLVVDGDPVDDITKLENILMVFRDGRLVTDNR